MLLILVAALASNVISAVAHVSEADIIKKVRHSRKSTSFLHAKRDDSWPDGNFSIIGEAMHLFGFDGAEAEDDEPIDVAVVGSGPLTEHDRKIIGTAKELYRFNSMPNLNIGEHVGTVFLRRAGYAGDRIWGLSEHDSACPRIVDAVAIVLVVNGQGKPISSEKLAQLRRAISRVEVAEESVKELTINGQTYHSRDFRADALFSTGFVGLAHVLNTSASVKKGSKVHVFGMNWNNHSIHSGGHPFDMEQKVIREHPQIVVHETGSDDYKPLDDSGKTRFECETNSGKYYPS